MLVKKLLLAVTLFLASLSLVAAAPKKPSVEPEIAAEVPQQGSWQDGATLFWLCQPGMKGKVKFMMVLPDGRQYPGELDCLSPTSKQI